MSVHNRGRIISGDIKVDIFEREGNREIEWWFVKGEV